MEEEKEVLQNLVQSMVHRLHMILACYDTHLKWQRLTWLLGVNLVMLKLSLRLSPRQRMAVVLYVLNDLHVLL